MMFGHHWEKGEATIVARKITGTSSDGGVTRHEYVADVVLASGAVSRATIHEPMFTTLFWAPSINDRVPVLLDSKDGKVKFDTDEPVFSSKARLAADDERFNAAAQGAPAPGAGFGAQLGEARAARSTIEAMFSGDPAAASAAADTLRPRG